MHEQDTTRFFEAITILGEVFDAKLSTARCTAYFEILADYAWPIVEIALKRAMREQTFFPKPAELIELIEGPRKDEAEQAWTQLQEIVRDYGPEFPLACYEPAFAEAISIFAGDWVDACRRIEAISERYHEAAARAKQESIRAEREVRQQWLKEEEALHWAFIHAYHLAQGRQSCVSARIFPALDNYGAIAAAPPPLGIQRGRPPWFLSKDEVGEMIEVQGVIDGQQRLQA